MCLHGMNREIFTLYIQSYTKSIVAKHLIIIFKIILIIIHVCIKCGKL